MKTDIHPEYRAIVFRDLGSGETFLTRSTATSDNRGSAQGPVRSSVARRASTGPPSGNAARCSASTAA